MRLRTPADFGALVRDRRRKARLKQKDLAGRAGVGRQWLVEFERGKPRASLALEALGMRCTPTRRAGRQKPGPRRISRWTSTACSITRQAGSHDQRAGGPGREPRDVPRAAERLREAIVAESWRAEADAFPLSMSMPLAMAENGNAKIDPYLWGLLPDIGGDFGFPPLGVRSLRRPGLLLLFFFAARKSRP